MLTNPHKTGTSRNRNQWGVITLAVCALLVLTQCDSGFVPDTGPPPNSTDARVQTVQKWYDTALAEERRLPPPDSLLAGKFDEDSTITAVLDAMVRQHPPDWDNMETWDNGHGGYWAATLLGGTPTSPSDPDFSVVRTLVADVDENGNILGGLLIEFIAPDLDESEFRDYVVQWIVGDWGNTPMLVAEYTIGYASTQAMFHAPGEAPVPITMQLVEKMGAGKTAATIWYCWVTVWYEGEVCVHGQYWGVCTRERHTETTCVCVSGCDDTGDGDTGDGDAGGTGGPGGVGGGCPGCGDSDDDDDSDDEDEEDEEEEDEDDSQCTEDQKAIAAEYDDETNWPCETFVDAVTSGTGTHGHDFGYLSGAYQGGSAAVLADVSIEHGISGWVTSDWRCPIGNANVGGSANSQHVQGLAGDFTAAGFDSTMHKNFEDAAINAGSVWSSGYGTGSDQYTGHIHIHW